MDKVIRLRGSMWRGQWLQKWPIRFLLGTLLVLGGPALLVWGPGFVMELDSWRLNSLTGAALAYAISFLTLRKLLSFPGSSSASYILPTLLIYYSMLALLFWAFRMDYSVYYLSYALGLNILFSFGCYFTVVRHIRQRLALVPMGKAKNMEKLPGAHWLRLEGPRLSGERVDAVVADLHADIPNEWERFLARCTLAGVPVYHYKHIRESLTGKVKVEHLSENEFGSLQPSLIYSIFKRLVDLAMSLLMLPLLLPVLGLVSLWIKKDSDGPALFIQERMGYRGELFRVYKFRSMYIDREGSGFTEGENDPRITPVGKIIRKYRIDELPQIFNVIKGDMSFIGPRPESRSLSEWYERDVPFFSYRHIVRPGISGWAQVEQGYAAEVDGMKEKLEYDFYYIKNFTLWLDALIVYKTIRTLLTGFGAR
ncbi:exopolysaccharide biosynthesis polyprenyl glycosylphosphotransferase [Zobellella maritima]|uniref:exopolysaccharide biosynthesis polyprenyl glycosylphosphotransferase n=1 Tax=Zobellella maritima TaxID=2059725 RepID=UPI001E4321ED|nr:exopolysaccharide biosynthesis polyprenyl glycosylphosphotransferase [Zobellella maritima]